MGQLTRLGFIMLMFAHLSSFCFGQSVTITVKDNKRNFLPGATIQIRSLVDSVEKYSITDQKGLAELSKIKDGPYFIKISFVGFETIQRTITVKQDRRSFDYQMKESTVTLGEATVAAKKPLIRQEEDKMIIDPEPMASISTNTLEILENTPGLYVDQDGGVYLNSASPAVVYINGREQKMSNQDVMSLLRSIPPGSVEKIEVLRTPSTKYDAASSGGIINIVLKKGVKLGRFGAVRAGMNQGRYGNRYIGVNFNNSGDKSTSYINVNFNRHDMLEELNTVRRISSDTVLSQKALSRQTSDQPFIGYGIVYDIRYSLSFSYDGRINTSFQQTDADNSNIIKAGESELLSESDNGINNDIDFISIQQDIGLLKKIDTSGSEWDTKLSYSYNSNNTLQDYNTEYILPFYSTLTGNGSILQQRQYIIFSSDLLYSFPKEFKIESGIKSSYQNFRSISDYTINYNGLTVDDSLRNSEYNHLENINAVYLQASKTFFKSFMLKAGVRMEHTYMNGKQVVPVDTSFKINRVDFFPYIYLSRTIIKMFDIELKGFLIYRRTISRPGYQQLNPSSKYIDQFLYEVGNPELKPQFTDNVEVNISYEEWPVFALGRNYTNDIFSSVIYRDEYNDKISVMTYDNIGRNEESYFRGMVGIPPGRIYFFALGAQYNLTEYDGVYANEPFQFTRGSWRFFTFHSLTILKNTRLTVSGFMMHNGLYNFYELNTFGQVNVGLRQSFLNNNLTVTINVRDILKTMVTQFEINQGGIHTSGSRYTDSQRWGINISYNFGLKVREEKKVMNGLLEPETAQ